MKIKTVTLSAKDDGSYTLMMQGEKGRLLMYKRCLNFADVIEELKKKLDADG